MKKSYKKRVVGSRNNGHYYPNSRENSYRVYRQGDGEEIDWTGDLSASNEMIEAPQAIALLLLSSYVSENGRF